VELTETSLAEDPQRAAEQLAALRHSGVEVSIDDFGSGFSSLSQLVALPAGVLKIDRSLVAGADGPATQAAAAVAAVVGLARAFGMRTVAEGVETAVQLAVTTELGCTFAQGYHLARPMPAAEIADWLLAQRTPAPS
jgi:EAL domain-containing protein (putative c-di-GMP-specific phosphodiesterase class I)